MPVDLDRNPIAKTKAFDLYTLKNKVLFFDYRDDITIELDDVKEAFDLYIEHSDNHSYKVLLAFGEFSSIDVNARNYAENKQMPTPAQAIVIKNLAQRMLAKFYKMLRKDSHPLKFFGNTDDAISWLNTQ